MKILNALLLTALLAGCQSLAQVSRDIEQISGTTKGTLGAGVIETECEGLDPYAPLVTAVRQKLAPRESFPFLTADPTTKIGLLEKYSTEPVRLGHLLYVECTATNKNIKPDRAAYIEQTYGRNKRRIISS